MNLSGKNILLGVSGSIAAYKAAEIASRLGKLGASVNVVLTRAAAEFVGPATFRALTLNPVLTSVFDEPFDNRIAHIEVAQTADLVLVAPATADVIAKMAHGIADDMLSTVLLATTAPIVVAPAMNTVMLEHPATQANLLTLRSRGVEIIDPGSGVLACRTEGYGKLAEVDVIVAAAVARLARDGKRVRGKESNSLDFEGIRVLITAGATREDLDPVRFISNRSSGKMGFALAEAARDRGAAVTVIAGSTTVCPPEDIDMVRVGTTSEMLEAAMTRFGQCDVLIAAAAPADYAPVSSETRKRKKTRASWTVELQETPDILAALSAARKKQILVGFAAETEDLLKNAGDKLKRKKLDLIVANDVTTEGAGFEVDTNVVTLLRSDGSCEQLPMLPKRVVADRILDEVRALLSRRSRKASR